MEYIIIAVLVFIIVVLVCREIVCWYFKIGGIVSVLMKGVVLLREVSNKLDHKPRLSRILDGKKPLE